ncbi:MAG: hypothetical protein FWF44_02005 [Defluviitaleaceae bacterium]|nr:hypothetical protein [Defluviitaleaceae bacterium]
MILTEHVGKVTYTVALVPEGNGAGATDEQAAGDWDGFAKALGFARTDNMEGKHDGGTPPPPRK